MLSRTPRKSPLARVLPLLVAPNPSPGPDGGGGGSSSPSIRSKEAWDAQACSRVPSTEKCSSLSSGLTSGAAISFSRNFPITCSLSSRSRFLVNVVGCQIASSGLSPTNQRNTSRTHCASPTFVHPSRDHMESIKRWSSSKSQHSRNFSSCTLYKRTRRTRLAVSPSSSTAIKAPRESPTRTSSTSINLRAVRVEA